LAAVVTILNDHWATLLWVDGQTAMLVSDSGFPIYANAPPLTDTPQNEKVTEAKEAAVRSVPDVEGDVQFRSSAQVPWAE
jgi:hypothetical protein